MSVIEEKKALRTYIRQTERTLDPAYKAESSEAICRCVLALEEYRAAGTVFAFAGTVHEIDTSLLLKETLAAGKTLVLPRCAEGHTLDLCVVTSMDELVPGMYGILEPKADCALVTPADIDFAVVPACHSTAGAAGSDRAAATMTVCCRSSPARPASSAASG